MPSSNATGQPRMGKNQCLEITSLCLAGASRCRRTGSESCRVAAVVLLPLLLTWVSSEKLE